MSRSSAARCWQPGGRSRGLSLQPPDAATIANYQLRNSSRCVPWGAAASDVGQMELATIRDGEAPRSDVHRPTREIRGHVISSRHRAGFARHTNLVRIAPNRKDSLVRKLVDLEVPRVQIVRRRAMPTQTSIKEVRGIAKSS